MLVIRQMHPDDADEKGYVHWKSWQETYPGLVDADFLSRMTPEEQQNKSRAQADHTVVAEFDNKIAGFARYGPCRDEDLPSCGEVYAIYILKEFQGLGLGRALMDATLNHLSGFDTIAIWVLEGNTHAAGFYHHYGFRFDGTRKEIVIGTPNTELRMIYHRYK